ncbi:hypothetical protein LWE61_15150 [Sphingobium sufflavum]|uniref:hypothetical protein n=1 Tax=Sphingobium sufflavum TaxID=1129547 RepID=UPI001F1600F3|nr:hypothetical protein [Sphingobium sufflavum]MCE7797886.1 hypothetical protein [Sphingobium sufflavum]
MADRPIPFSAPMVRALLDGRKTQTRRVLNLPPAPSHLGNWEASTVGGPGILDGEGRETPEWPCVWHTRTGAVVVPAFTVGDRLYVREEYYHRGHWAPVDGAQTKGGKQKWAFVPADDVILFDAPADFRKGRHSADPATVAWHKRLGRFMPRAASRLTLAVTDVRVERLNDCSEADALAEGIDRIHFPEVGEWGWPQRRYAELWDSINGPGAWDANPWVVAVTFEVRKGNIDAASDPLSMWVVTENPSDFPGKFVARLWFVTAGAMATTEYYHVSATLEGVRELLPPGLACIQRSPGDEPTIVEIWL